MRQLKAPIWAAAALWALSAGAPPAAATGRAVHPTRPAHITLVHRHTRSAPATVRPNAAATARSAWTGSDPTKGPGIERLRELQRQGVCVIDEGYGRYTFCDSY